MGVRGKPQVTKIISNQAAFRTIIGLSVMAHSGFSTRHRIIFRGGLLPKLS